MRAPHVADVDAESPYRLRAGAELGERLVTPVRAITVDGERIEPGRDRFSPAHPWVQQRPECFRPCAAGDKATADRMRELCERAERRLMTRDRDALERSSGQASTPSTSSGGLRLPSSSLEVVP